MVAFRPVEPAARRKLLEEHLPLVQRLASKVARQVSHRVELDDLVAYGTQGLAEAADRFDPTLGVAFGAFATYRIRGAIYDGLRQLGHLPKSEYAKIQARDRANHLLENLGERDAGARAAGRPAPTVSDDVRAMAEAMSNVVTSWVTSLQHLQDKGFDPTTDAPSAEERLSRAQLGAKLTAALAKLPEKERHFITKHYVEEKTLLEAGAELGLSKSWSSRLHARAIEQLRELLAED